MTDNRSVELSIVVPVLNEQDGLRPLYNEIPLRFAATPNYEIIFVDDGSTDKSVAVLSDIQSADPKVRVICFRRNFGQTAALSAGFKYARGRIIVPMDADGQNDPADIPRLVEKLETGFDIVSGWRRRRHDNMVTRTFPSRIANWVIARITGVKLHDFGCTLKAYRAESASFVSTAKCTALFRPGKLGRRTRRRDRCQSSFSHHRKDQVRPTHLQGDSRFDYDQFASFSTKPIYVFGGLGVIGFLGAFLSGLGLIYFKYFASPPLSLNRNPLLILMMILFTTAIQFILMGLLAEILVRTYHESRGREIYLIDRILQADDQG